MSTAIAGPGLPASRTNWVLQQLEDSDNQQNQLLM